MNDNRKLSEGIFDPINDNVQRLSQLFPSAVKDGKVEL